MNTIAGVIYLHRLRQTTFHSRHQTHLNQLTTWRCANHVRNIVRLFTLKFAMFSLIRGFCRSSISSLDFCRGSQISRHVVKLYTFVTSFVYTGCCRRMSKFLRLRTILFCQMRFSSILNLITRQGYEHDGQPTPIVGGLKKRQLNGHLRPERRMSPTGIIGIG